MATPDPRLLDAAQTFAGELADTLSATVCHGAPIQARVHDSQVVVAALKDDGGIASLPLTIRGRHALDLRILYHCTSDSTGQHLAIDSSQLILHLLGVRSPIVRFDYQRERGWAPAHVQLHAESSTIGYVRALGDQRPETWRLHLPVGGARFRPSLEDIIEFVAAEFSVDVQPGWDSKIAEGRTRWQRVQVLSAIRDVIQDDVGSADELKAAVDDARSVVLATNDDNNGAGEVSG